jgi:hypothetical protein
LEQGRFQASRKTKALAPARGPYFQDRACASFGIPDEDRQISMVASGQRYGI